MDFKKRYNQILTPLYDSLVVTSAFLTYFKSLSRKEGASSSKGREVERS